MADIHPADRRNRKGIKSNIMTYLELMKATMGKDFICKSDARRRTRTQFYFEASSEEINLLINGFEGNWFVKDKIDWRDGHYLEKTEMQALYG